MLAETQLVFVIAPKSDEPDAPIIPSDFFAFDGKNLSREDLKREIYDELMRP